MKKKKPKPGIVPEPDEIKLVNCANETCKAELLGDSAWQWLDKLAAVERHKFPPECRRWAGRPYCPSCHFAASRPARLAEQKRQEESEAYSHGIPGERRGRMVRDEDPSLENAVRDMEDTKGIE